MHNHSNNCRRDGSKTRERFARFVPLILNLVAILLAIRFLMYPSGKALFLPFDGIALLLLGICGALIALPLSIARFLKNEAKLSSLVGMVFSLTPIPVYLFIFWLINQTKQFRFW